MDVSALDDKGFKVWVRFLDARVLMRYVGLDELRSIREQATSYSWLKEGESQEPEESFDHEKANRLFGRAAVRDWQGLTRGGEDFSFSPERCDLLMSRWSEFARFVAEVSLDLKRLEDERMEKSKKKSSATCAQEGILEG